MSRYLSRKFRKAILLALEHDVINTAKAAAYSGMLMLFPALLVLTTLLAQVQEGTTLVGEIRSIFEQFLPADTMDLLQSYVLTRRIYSGAVDPVSHRPQHLCRARHDAVVDGGLSPRLSASARGLGLWRTADAGPAAGAHRTGSAFGGYAGDCLRSSDRIVDDRKRRPRVAPCRAVLVAHGALVGRVAHQRHRTDGPLPLRNQADRTLVVGGAGRSGRYACCGFPPRWPSAGM